MNLYDKIMNLCDKIGHENLFLFNSIFTLGEIGDSVWEILDVKILNYA